MKSPNAKRTYRTLPKLTPEQYRKVRKLTNRCCNKDRGNCLLLGQSLPLSVFGDERAEQFLIQSDHLAIHCTKSGGKSKRPAV